MPTLQQILLLSHVAATWYMVGVIWFVQIVHYPLFGEVGDNFNRYQQANVRVTTWVVLPPMLIEVATSMWLLLQPKSLPLPLLWIGAALIVFIWLSTFLIQVPQHTKLGEGFNTEIHGGLVRLNWLRTIAWSFRGLLVMLLLVSSMR